MSVEHFHEAPGRSTCTAAGSTIERDYGVSGTLWSCARAVLSMEKSWRGSRGGVGTRIVLDSSGLVRKCWLMIW